MKEQDSRQEQRASRVDHLTTLQLSGEGSWAETEELVNKVRKEPEAIESYVESIIDSTNLRWLAESRNADVQGRFASDSPYPQSQSIVPRLLGIGGLGGAFALGACLLFAVFLMIENPDGHKSSEHLAVQASDTEQRVTPLRTQADTAGRQVATVLRLRNASWSRGSLAIEELSRISTGQTLHLRAGEAELVFDSAVRLVVRGPALLEVRSPTEIYSRFGVLAARVGEEGKGFVIETPSGRIVDLGTEFGVAVDERGATDVAVFRGAVNLTYGAYDGVLEPSVTRRVVQGQALTLSADGSMKRLVAYDDTRFPGFRDEPLPLPTSQPGIFSSVTDNIRDGIGAKSYRIVPGGLREDALAYVDRRHEWNGINSAGIPDVLKGADYIMPFNVDKYSKNLTVEVGVGRPARVYIFISNMAQVPEWLSSSFIKTNMTIGLDESGEFVEADGYHIASGPGKAVDTEFFVWQRDVKSPATIALGSVKQARRGWGFCMYGIAAVPLEVAQLHDVRDKE